MTEQISNLAKVTLLFELLNDPQLTQVLPFFKTDIMAALDRTPGVAASVPQPRFNPTPAPVGMVTRVVHGFKTGNGIQERIKSLNLPSQFSSEEVFSALTNQRFEFTAKDPKGAVRDALHKLISGKKPAFKMVKKGMGGLPSIYERI